MSGHPGAFSYVRGQSTAGFIYNYGREQRFFSVCTVADHPDLSLRDCVICSSAVGLILCRYVHPFLGTCYAVCNPYVSGSMRIISNPPNGPLHLPDRAALTLVVYPHPLRPLKNVFHVVCAVSATSPCGSHQCFFRSYSSRTDWWRLSGPHVLGRVREETGVSAGSKAYWLLHGSPSAVYYNALLHSVGTIQLPDAYASFFPRWQDIRLKAEGLPRRPYIRLQAQLGSLGNELCFVAAWGTVWRSVYVYETKDDGFVWSYRKDQSTYELRREVMLSRFEGNRLHVPFWFYDRGLVILDHSREAPRVPAVQLEGPLRNLSDDILPVVHTLLHPVLDFFMFQI